MIQTLKGIFKAKRGLKETLPTLDEAVFGFTTDTEELFVGSSTGNVQLAKQADLDNTNTNVGQKSDKTYVDTQTGDLTSLQTIDKSNLVKAINENVAQLAQNTQRHKNIHVDLVEDYSSYKVAVAGGYDWSPSLQQAINDLTSGAIFIPAGNYDFYSKIFQNKSNITIQGSGVQTVLNLKFNGELFESNKGSWNGSTGVYTKGVGSSLSSIIYRDLVMDGGNQPNGVGLHLAGVTRGSKIDNVKFRNFAKAVICNECWDFSLINPIFETNTLGMEIDCENNNFMILHAVFSNNLKHLDMPGLIGINRKLSILSGSFDGLGANGGCSFKNTNGLTIKDIYMECYTGDAGKSTKNFLEFGMGLLATNIEDCHMISPSDGSYTQTWINLTGNSIGFKIDGNHQQNTGSNFINATGATRVSIGELNRVEGNWGTLPIPNVLTPRSESMRFPATTTTDEWKMIVTRTRNSRPIPKVSVFFDGTWTPGGQRLRIIRMDTSAVILDVEFPRQALTAYQEYNMGSLPVMSEGIVLQAYLYKIGSSIATPAGTIIIDQF